MKTRPVTLAAMLSLASLLAACSAPMSQVADDDRPRVVATTGIIADLVRNVAGDAAVVESIVPEGGDPHSYEPSLRDVRDIAYADTAFSNYLMLEEQSIIRALDANLRDGVPHVALAEQAAEYAAEIIPLVEDLSLDTAWVGLRVEGDGADVGAGRTSEVLLSATGASGPGEVTAYLTGTFGEPEIYFGSADGFEQGDGYRDDTVALPPAAHTHVSWAFDAPGVYELDLQARLQVERDERPIDVGSGTVVFAVGIDPHSVPGRSGATVIDGGHSDITVDLDSRDIAFTLDHEHTGGDLHREVYDLDDIVVEVPNKALHEVPGDPAFRFLGRAGEPLFQLPQAVLGKHVHGEIDPHLWQDVGNAIAYVKAIRDQLVAIDPGSATAYRDNAEAYILELDALDAEVRSTLAQIPESRRTLVTTHDAFGYLGAAYGMEISGFVSPNPGVEPSLADRRRLTETLRNLDVPAVFLEPNLAARSSTLVEVAEEQGIDVCRIYGDAFDEHVTDYIEMMRANARSLHDCLGTPEGF